MADEPETERTDDASRPAGAAAKKRKRDRTGPIIVVVSIVGVVIAWISYKHQAAAASTAPGMVPTSGGLGSGTVAGGLSSGNNSGLDQLITNLGDLVTQLQTPVSGTVGNPIHDNFPVYKRFINAPVGGGIHGTVYSIENGTATPLTNQQWLGLGTPGFSTVTTQDSDYALVQQSQQPSPATPSPHTVAGSPPPAAPSRPPLPTYTPTRIVRPS